jgi:hypothetical protein
MRAALAGIVVLALVPWHAAAWQRAPSHELDALVALINEAADEYSRVFSRLTAEETKTIELVARDGRVERRREIVSDLLVYQPARGGEVTEYRDVIAVDGVPKERRGERALALLRRASRESTIRRELEAIDRETSRYDFERHLRGFAIQPLRLPRDWRATHDVFVDGEEPLDGLDTTVVRYRERVPQRSSGRGMPLPRELAGAPLLWQGRAWIDPRTGQVRHSITELTVRHPAVREPLVVVRGERRYVPSRFGIHVPDRLVFEWRQHFSPPSGQPPAFGLSERTTFTYSRFRRFRVATSEGIDIP